MPWNIRHPYQCLIPIDDRDIFTIVQLPLAFVRSGHVGIDAGNTRWIGNSGYGWSRVLQSDYYVYGLRIYPIEIHPSYGNNRWNGFPLCRLYHHSSYP